MAQVSILKPTDRPWPCTRGGSLKITASPSVTTLPFRSHMLLKKQQRLTERIHKIFSQPFPGFVRPMNGLFLDCEWPQQCTMSWESEPLLHNDILQLCQDVHIAHPFLLYVISWWKMNQISGKCHLHSPEGSSHKHCSPTQVWNCLRWNIWSSELIIKMI